VTLTAAVTYNEEMNRRPLTLTSAAVVAVVLGTGCGSSGFHSATHYYSVHQVQAAFAGHGFELHKDAKQKVTSFVGLRSNKILVTVRVVKQRRAFPSFGLGFGPDTAAKHGNVLVIYKLGEEAPVKAALADLH
jgi:hypothetical protein